MKKLFLFTLLVLALAVPAYSQDVKLDFRASGFFDMTTGLWRWNNFYGGSTVNAIINTVNPTDKPATAFVNGVPVGGGQWNKTSSYVSQRGRLKFDAIMGKELSGTIFFEMDSQTWGDTARDSQPQQRNHMGYWQGDRAGVEIKNLYFDVAIPYVTVPMTARFGVQPFGVRSNVFMYTDGAGITVAAKVDPVTIIGYWAKALEGRIATSDDVDGYGLQINAKVDTFTLGGYAWWFKHGTYPLNSVDVDQADYGKNRNPIQGDVYWLAAFADGKLGPVNINFDFVYDTGKLKDKTGVFDSVKYDGMVARLKIDYPWEAFNFGLVGMYGSGADATKTGALGVPGEKVLDPTLAALDVRSTKVHSYVVPVQSETGADDSEVLFGGYVTGGFGGWAYTQNNNYMTRGTYGGLWFAKLYGSYKASPEYKVTLQGLYIGDTTKHGDTLGYALSANGGLKNGASVGWEADVINEWQVYKNLVFRFSGGFLVPGNALKFWDPINLKNSHPDTPWALWTRLIYNF